MSDAANPKILIGASIPRSGHHFLADMMRGYFGSDLYYCEYYTLANCCKTVPCTRRGAFRYIYQKSHDRDFKLPADVAEALYLIQYRHPVPEALSDRELDLKDQLGRPSLNYRRTRAGFIQWLAGKALYYRRFHDKWMANRLSNALYLDYNTLSGDAAGSMRAIIDRAGARLDAQRLENVVQRFGGSRSGANQTFKPRVNTDSPYFDADLLGALEDYVLKRCPAFGFSRELGGSYLESPIYALILLRDANEPLPPGESKRFKYISQIAPDHPEVLRRNANRTLREKNPAQGIKQLGKLIEQHPYFAPAYRLLFDACADQDVAVPEAALTGNAILACSEDAQMLLALAEAFQAKGYAVNAVAAEALAAQIEPKNDEARVRLAESLLAAKK